MEKDFFSIIIPVLNAQNYIEKSLNSLLKQSYRNFEIIIFDNGSKDNTLNIIEKYKINFSKNNVPLKLIKSKKNHYVGGAFNRSFFVSKGEFIMLLCADVFLNYNFLQKALEYFKKDKNLGALQPKIYRFDLKKGKTNIIDTCGFVVYKSRRIINLAHGKKDSRDFSSGVKIFGVEGACAVFRKNTLKDCIIFLNGKKEIFDEDMVWYGDDFDLAFRINLLGWKQMFFADLIAWHDRKTTKRTSNSFLDFIKIRKEIPQLKKTLDYRNTRLALLKNENFFGFLKHLPYFLKREVFLLIYFLFFEPKTLIFGLSGFLKLFPKIYKKRKILYKKISKDNIKYTYKKFL